MEIYSPKKYKNQGCLKNNLKSEKVDSQNLHENRNENSITMQIVKERTRERFYNVMQYLFDIREVEI